MSKPLILSLSPPSETLMEFHRRKLMSDSDKSSEECSSFCDSDINKSAFCPSSCFSDCPKVCRFSLTLPSKPLKISPYLILSLSLLATAIFLVFLYVIYIKCYSRRRRLSRRINSEAAEAGRDDFIDEDQEPVVDHPIWYIRTVGLQPAVISAITICKYKKGDGLVEGTECSVCLNEFQEDETLRLLPKCNHAFHIPCIDTWLSSHTNCPMCRAGIVSTATGAPSPEQSLENSGPLEEAQEAQLEVPDNSDRIEEMEEIVCEREFEVRVDDNDIQPMRRSVSMDSLSASVLTLALADLCPEKTNKNNNNGDSNSESQSSNSGKSSNMPIIPKRVCGNQSLLKLMESSSMGRILQSGSSSMKRSFSCSGKLFLTRHNRRRSWVLPL